MTPKSLFDLCAAPTAVASALTLLDGIDPEITTRLATR